ncbi:MAG: decaprenyl-phosphate phosphoribosyltransferase [Microcoleus vaginatus WJT46-NPBG5]|nr:decaprenyl-phosphate phosphoribosyltransferase [Microcoleus vaginatus WJT46-NPBG5]
MDRHRTDFKWTYYYVTLMIKHLFKLLRPHQWTKNLFCLAGLFFSGKFLEPAAIAEAFLAVAMFSFMASVVYIFNDIQDVERDREHPKKRYRPIASGKISVKAATAIALFLIVVALLIAYSLGMPVLVCLVLYAGINISYSLKLKHLALFDVNCIALGFVLRLLAGVYAIEVIPTGWITLCTFFLALFLGFAKRRSELLGLLSNKMTQDFLDRQESESIEIAKPVSELFYLQLFYQRGQANPQRPVLSQYTLPFLDSLLNSTATMTVMCYALFTAISGKNPSLVITVPIVHYAVMHYKHLVMVREGGEEPDRILIKDARIKLSILIWLISYFLIIYSNVNLFA